MSTGNLITIVENGEEEPLRRETRDLNYNEWHRRQTGDDLGMVDIDAVEMCKRCQKPLAFIELVRNTGSNRVGIDKKCSMVTSYIAMLTRRPCFVLFYSVNETDDDLTWIKVKQVKPDDGFVVEMSPEEWAGYLRYLHDDHKLLCKKQRKGVVNEIDKERRTKMKAEQDEGLVPEQYNAEEVLMLAGTVADRFMTDNFKTPQGEHQEGCYDTLRNEVAEAMEVVMREWRGPASVPLPVELVVKMREAAWKLVRDERSNTN